MPLQRSCRGRGRVGRQRNCQRGKLEVRGASAQFLTMALDGTAAELRGQVALRKKCRGKDAAEDFSGEVTGDSAEPLEVGGKCGREVNRKCAEILALRRVHGLVLGGSCTYVRRCGVPPRVRPLA